MMMKMMMPINYNVDENDNFVQENLKYFTGKGHAYTDTLAWLRLIDQLSVKFVGFSHVCP